MINKREHGLKWLTLSRVDIEFQLILPRELSRPRILILGITSDEKLLVRVFSLLRNFVLFHSDLAYIRRTFIRPALAARETKAANLWTGWTKRGRKCREGRSETKRDAYTSATTAAKGRAERWTRGIPSRMSAGSTQLDEATEGWPERESLSLRAVIMLIRSYHLIKTTDVNFGIRLDLREVSRVPFRAPPTKSSFQSFVLLPHKRTPSSDSLRPFYLVIPDSAKHSRGEFARSRERFYYARRFHFMSRTHGHTGGHLFSQIRADIGTGHRSNMSFPKVPLSSIFVDSVFRYTIHAFFLPFHPLREKVH